MEINKTKYLDFTHARTDDQIELMKKINDDGVCPFCAEHFKKYHPKEVLKETDWWFVTENMSPYEGTEVHLIFVYKKHVTMISEVLHEAMAEIPQIVAWAEKEFGLKGGALFMRFGDTRYTGGSVDHLHVQYLVGNAKSDDENREGLKIKLGYKKGKQ